MKKQKNKYLIPVSILSLTLLLVSGVVIGGMSLKGMIADRVADNITEDARALLVEEDVSLGAFPGTDVYERMRFHDGIVATTFHESLNWGTSSPDGAQIVNAEITNDTNTDLFCDPHSLILDVSTAVAIAGGSYRVGTTTKSGDESLTATTTATLIGLTAIASTTASVITVENATVSGTYFAEGSYVTSTPFLFLKNEKLVATMDGVGGFVSSTDFTTAGGFAGVGTVSLNCVPRYR
uniref:Uncharacterized protein n=1 Tax=viral metagenome TaxID=1070528 RepID=A0A6H1ZZV8_9ZZZZ